MTCHKLHVTQLGVGTCTLWFVKYRYRGNIKSETKTIFEATQYTTVWVVKVH